MKKFYLLLTVLMMTLTTIMAQTITTSPITITTKCSGDTVKVIYTITGTFTAGNIFTAQLSNATGAFTSPVNIGTLTSTAAGSIIATIPTGTTTGTGYKIRVVSNTPIITGSTSISTLTINAVPAAPSVTPAARCSTGVVTLSATPGTNEVIKWYSASTGGTLYTTANSYTTASISASTTYYALDSNTVTKCVASSRVAVLATVNALPAAPSVTPASRCSTGVVTLSATPGGANEVIKWYSASTGGTLYTTANSYTTPSITTNTTYYALDSNTVTTCVASSRVAVLATINALPAAPSVTPASGCSGGVVTLSATPGGANEVIKWYSASTGGTLYTTANSYTTPTLTTNTTYYALDSNTVTTCIAASRVSVLATVNALPAAPSVTPASRCSTGVVTLSATPGGANEVIKWYSASTGGTLYTTANSYTTPSITTNTTYYALDSNTVTTCIAASRVEVLATINANPVVTAGPTNSATSPICAGTNFSLTATGGAINALAFTSNSSVSISSFDISPAVFPTLTASAWVYRTGTTTYGEIISNDDGGYDRAIVVASDGNYYIFAGTDINTGIPSVINKWEFVSVTWSPSGITFYKNGVSVFTTTVESASSGIRGTSIGNGTNANPATTFIGAIDQVSVFSSARTALELQNEMNFGLVGSEPGLQAFYLFNEGSGTTTADASPYARTGTLSTAGVSLKPTWTSSSAPTGFASYLWSPDGQTTPVISVSPTTSTNYSVQVTNSFSCSATSNAFNLTVNPIPVGSATAQTICNGVATSVALNSTVSGTTFTWTAALQSGTVTGFSNQTTGVAGPIAQTLTNTTTTARVVRYTVTPTANGCSGTPFTVDVTITPTYTVGTASTSPTLCINSALTNITHTTIGATGIGTATGLPTGVTASWANNVITISGTPTQSGTFNYTIPLAGGCATLNATGSITVNAINTVSVASSTPTLCINTALTNITHTTTGATGIGTPTGLPTGVTASWANNVITIRGTPTQSGIFNYTIPLIGGCGSVNATGTITVNPNNTVSAASSTPTLCINTALTNITHSTTGATGIGTATGLPTGVTASWANNIITIIGTPAQSGTFNYTIPLAGGCGSVNATGSITVNAINTVSVASSTPTLCINTALTNITHSTTRATGIGTATGLPTGVTSSWANNIITISGTPTESGTFNYIIPLTGGCGSVNATGTITVNQTVVGVASSTPTLCINTALTNITHTTTVATGIGTPTGLPTGVTASWANNLITISGTPTQSGTFNYTIPLIGGCGSVNAAGTIKVAANAPTITSFTPLSGSPGTLVTILGTNLYPNSLSIGGVPAIVISTNGNTLVGMVMPGATTGGISINNACGQVSSNLNFTVTPTSYPFTQQGSGLEGSNQVSSQTNTSVSLSADGNTAIVGGASDDSNNGAFWIYTRSGSTWTQQGNKMVGSGAIGTARQGLSVALSADGNTAIVGGPGDDSFKGAAWIYTRSGGVWTQQGNKMVGTGAIGTARQGFAVSLSADGNTAIVGGVGDDSFKGAAWIYTRSGGVWTQQGNKMVGDGAIGTARQGNAVALSADGNTAIVGGNNDDSNKGAAWIYTRSGGVWTQQGNKMVGDGAIGTARQGNAVALSADGNTAIVGGNYDGSTGAAWIYTRSGDVWTQQGSKLNYSRYSYFDCNYNMGTSVSLSADGYTAMVTGLNTCDGDYSFPSAQLYTRLGNVWTFKTELMPQNINFGQFTGISIGSLSLDGNTGIIGALPYDYATNKYTISARVFLPGIKYNGNQNTGGTAPADTAVQIGTSIILPGNTGFLEKTRYRFIGWNTNADGSGTSYAAGANIVLTASMVLYAQWSCANENIIQSISTCGVPYTWHGVTYTQSGTYTYGPFTNTLGCDSINSLELTINEIPSATIVGNSGVCNGNNSITLNTQTNIPSVSYLWSTGATTSSITVNTVGTYAVTVTNNTNGCSTNTSVEVKNPSSTTNVTNCSPYLWNGVNYTSSGVYTYTTPSTLGCDSTAILNFTVTPANTVGAASSSPTLCINTALTNITHSTTGATGIIPSDLPNYSLPPAVYYPTNNEDLGNVTISLNGSIVLNNTTPINSLSGTIGTAAGTAGSYTDFSAFGPYAMYQGSTYSFSLSSIKNGYYNYNNSMAIYIDYNRNGVFTDAGEKVYAASAETNGPHTETGTFTIPAYAALGSTRMRVICNEGLITSPTQQIFYGECEEYSLNIRGFNIATLPPGVTASWANNIITISGTPTQSGTFNYIIPLAGGCGSVNATGTITVNPNNTVSAASSTPTLCINTALTNITHSTTGATGIGTASGLPTGVTASWLNNVITISGTPTQSGTFNYSIPLMGGCGSANATGTITVNPANIAGAASTSPSLCNNTALTNITHTTTGATGIGTASGLPTGVTASWLNNVITISGTPTQSGTFNYSIPLTGGCGGANATGTITVLTQPTVTVNCPAFCPGASTTVSATPGAAGTYSYLWTVPSGATNPGNVSSFNTSTVGTYSVVITNQTTNCSSIPAIGKVTLKLNPTVAISGSTSFCDGGNTQLYASATAGIPRFISTAAGGSHSLFLDNDGTVWATGLGSDGQLGDGTFGNRNTLGQVSGLSGITAIAAGKFYSLFLKNDGTVWATGYNGYGQLGDGTTATKTTPVQVSGLSGITAITAGEIHSLFLKNDGTVRSTGYNTSGQLGDGTTATKTTPVQVSGLSGITAIAAGSYHSLFLKNDGTVRSTGYNTSGQLGDGTTAYKTTPVQVSGLSGITAIAAGSYHSLFLKNDSTMRSTGLNTSGQLGDGTIVNKKTPVQVSGLSGITAIAAGGVHSLFLKNDSTMRSTGYNNYGQLGDGTTATKTTPIQVKATSTITSYQWMLNGSNLSGATNVLYTAASAGSYSVMVTNSYGCTAAASAPVTVISPVVTVNSPGVCSGASTTLVASTTASTNQFTYLPVDRVAGATLAIGLRKLRTSYAGSALRLRRSSDNQEQDFGFVGNDLDMNSINTWLNGASAYCTILYDQSGSGGDVSQADVTAQPLLVLSDVNNKPVLRFNTAQYMNNDVNYPSPYSVVYGSTVTGTSSRVLSTKNNNWLLGYWGESQDAAFFEGWVADPTTPTVLNQYNVYAATGTGAISTVFKNGTQLISNDYGLEGPNGIQLNGSGFGEYSDVDITDVIIYGSALSSGEINALNNSIASYYGGEVNNQNSYLWSTGDTTSSISVNTVGTYTVSVTSPVGCTTIATSTVTLAVPSESTTHIQVCSVQLPYVWNGASYTASGVYTFTGTNAAGCDSLAILDLTINICPTTTTLNVTAFLEGFYTGNGTMTANLYNLGISTDDTETDSVEVNLWSAANLSSATPDYSVRAVLHTNGTLTAVFPGATLNNSYYVSLKHRNSLEVWSAAPVTIASTGSYNFSTSLSSAYTDGFNDAMKSVSVGKYALFAGDVNQDGTVDVFDAQITDNGAANLLFGYDASDCNGDGSTDVFDLQLIDNNSTLLLYYARPY